MKKTILVLVCTVLLAAQLLSSCSFESGVSDGAGTGESKTNKVNFMEDILK